MSSDTEGKIEKYGLRTIDLLLATGLVLWWALILFGIYSLAVWSIEPIRVFFGAFYLNVIGVVGILVFGLFLFWFRETYRMQYGLLEIAFGLVSGWFGISKTESAGYAEAIGVIAAIYLIVRGLDNYFIGAEKKKWLPKKRLVDMKY